MNNYYSAITTSLYVYSPLTNGFYPRELREVYDDAGSWPDDGIAVSDVIYREYQTLPAPEGKMRVAGADGLPAWADIPAPTIEALKADAVVTLSGLMTKANLAIAPLQDAVDIEDATDDEIAKLKDWKKYRVALNRLNLSLVPDIDWPQLPE
ncbi:tail fiber assembly protein [Rahnella aceris]|uniref:tail fiber assembly protein n=1 Tax=Rahnella sp. (strain Y9602) TaxID=2703885 RepID=UPI001C26667F|nr:tail fiber assembly protein [Rahnella aceris]MBU9850084.1 tail fiber assembly protein [Rahnella aceris]